MIDPRNFRLKFFIATAVGALLTAAALRHILHVYGGISREEIRWDALTFAALGIIVIVLFRRASKQ
jgi:hypothetical protein